MSNTRRLASSFAVAGILIVAITLVLAGLLFSSYNSTIEREQTNLRNLASAFAAQTHYATMALDMMLVDGTRHAGRFGGATAGTLDGVVPEDIPARVVMLAPPGNQADPPGSPPDSAAQIGINVIDSRNGRAKITLTRALPASGGRPGGAIRVEADSVYFEHIFNSADLGKGGSVTLLQRDGTMLVRSPALAHAIGRSFLATPLFMEYLPRNPAGAFLTASPIDGTPRLYGYATVAGYPLVIITGRDKSDTLEVWHGWLEVTLLAWALLSGTLLLLAWRIGRESARQATLIERLTSSEARLKHSYGYLSRILDTLATPLWVLDAQRRIVLSNRAFRQFATGGGQALAGRAEAEVLDPAGAAARERLYAAVTDEQVHVLEAEVRNGANEQRTVIQLSARLESDEQAEQIVNSFIDITERKQVELRLAYLSDFDPATGLPNHNQLRRVLGDALQAAAARAEQVALLLVALERLQEVADLLGHEAGEEAVCQIAARLDAVAPQALCTARVKANEFGLILPGTARRTADQFAIELHALLSEPVRVREREFHLAPVIGIALYPRDAGSAAELIRLADIAKHRARSHSGDPIHFHSDSTHTQLNERLSVEEQLRRALAREELTLAYQPKVEIASGRIVGFEVLLRWNNAQLGTIAPNRFIPIAEQTGLIVPIGDWVLRTACRDASTWLREYGTSAKVAVNLSIRQFYQRDLLQAISSALSGAGLAPDALELEITESIAMSRVDVVERLLGGIRDLGVELSIDDFGTGYSSLAYLKRFPVQRLKVDRAFVRDLGRDADSVAIVRSIVALGHGLGMRIVAEGVETDEQLGILRALGCDEYQGFLFARPVDAAAVPLLLREAPARGGRAAG